MKLWLSRKFFLREVFVKNADDHPNMGFQHLLTLSRETVVHIIKRFGGYFYGIACYSVSLNC